MENVDDMQKLMGQLFPCYYSRFFPNLVNVVEGNSFVPFGCITKGIFKKFSIISSMKQILINERWENFVEINSSKMLNSHEMYLEYLMFACLTENRLSYDIFDSILSVSGLMICISIEMLEKTGVNFCELTVDIFMVFYKNVLKEKFFSHGGFKQFTEYICHEYQTWEMYLDNNYEDSNFLIKNGNGDSLVENANIKIEKELKKVLYQPDFIEYNDVKNSICHSFAKEVLSTTKVRLPPLLSSNYRSTIRDQNVSSLEGTNGNIFASKLETMTSTSKYETMASTSKTETKPSTFKSEPKPSISKTESEVSTSKNDTKASTSKTDMSTSTSKTVMSTSTSKSEMSTSTSKSEISASTSKTETKASALRYEKTSILKSETMARVLQRCLKPVSDSQANIIAEKKANIAWCDNIVASVINYNSLKSSSFVKVNKQLQEADKILGSLKDTIKSVEKVLQDYVKE